MNVTAYVHNSTTISVAWLPVPRDDRNGRIIEYRLDMNGGSSFTRSKSVKVPEGEEDKTQNVIVYRLKKYRTYTIMVSAATSKGFSWASDAIEETTAEDGKSTILIRIGPQRISIFYCK